MILVIAWSVVNILVDYIGQGGKIWLHMKYPTGVEDPEQLNIRVDFAMLKGRKLILSSGSKDSSKWRSIKSITINFLTKRIALGKFSLAWLETTAWWRASTLLVKFLEQAPTGYTGN